VKALQAVRVCKLLVVTVLMTSLSGADLRAQVGISSYMTQVALVVRAPAHAVMPGVSAHREIGRRGDLREAAVRIHLRANSGYRLVARTNAGATSRLWIHLADDHFQELVPGSSVTLLGRGHGSSEREVRYLTDGSSSLLELPVRFELVIDPVI
jgi:hypothetical protein